jgi:hypothetical protein
MRTHRFDPISFVFGLGFLGLALLFAIPAEPLEIYFGGLSLGWVWPVLAIAAGLALLAPVLRSGRAEPDPSDDEDAIGI